MTTLASVQDVLLQVRPTWEGLSQNSREIQVREVGALR